MVSFKIYLIIVYCKYGSLMMVSRQCVVRGGELYLMIMIAVVGYNIMMVNCQNIFA